MLNMRNGVWSRLLFGLLPLGILAANIEKVDARKPIAPSGRPARAPSFDANYVLNPHSDQESGFTCPRGGMVTVQGNQFTFRVVTSEYDSNDPNGDNKPAAAKVNVTVKTAADGKVQASFHYVGENLAYLKSHGAGRVTSLSVEGYLAEEGGELFGEIQVFSMPGHELACGFKLKQHGTLAGSGPTCLKAGDFCLKGNRCCSGSCVRADSQGHMKCQ